jgi:peptidoglycan/xylan/chitin deacetylase (PgdA/CDA1 family)
MLLVMLGACGGTESTPTPTASLAPSRPASEEPSVVPSPSLEPSVSLEPSPFGGTEHTVRGGESLTGIARLYGATLAQLQEWNAGRYPSIVTDPGIIEPGWVLVVSLEPGVTPAPTPAAPAETPPPSGSGCTAGGRVAAGQIQVFRTIPNAGPSVALTFDMGGRMEPAVDIMNFLVANRVCATIFATGVMSQTPQGQQVMAIIKAHPELFEIGNHTMYHCDLVRGGGGSPSTQPCTGSWSPDRIRKELTDAEAILRAGTGQNPQPYWRPPYGSYNDAVLEAVASVGYTKTFMWDIDTVDWKPIGDGGPTSEQIASKVIGSSVNGSNVLFHLGGYETLDALRLIVPGLRDRGFTLTSLSDLLR